MSAHILQIEHLSKSFRSHWSFRSKPALHDISLGVFRGESFGFLGQNGAGKTTTIKCIIGLLKKTSGRVFFDGELLEGPSLHKNIGYLPELPYFYDHLTVRETLDFFACLHGIESKERSSRVDEVLGRVGLLHRRNDSIRALSKGLQQRVGFAQAIINRPALLLLDEPFSGLDPLGRREMRDLILELKAQGTTIFLSSHILSDVEEICDRVSIMKQGALKAVFYLKDIPSMFGDLFELAIATDDAHAAAGYFGSVERLATNHDARPTAQGAVHTFQFPSAEKARAALHEASKSGARIVSFQSVGLRLEDIFIKITAEQEEGNSFEATPGAEHSNGVRI